MWAHMIRVLKVCCTGYDYLRESQRLTFSLFYCEPALVIERPFPSDAALTSLAPQKLSVNVSYIIDGAAVSGTPICEDQATPGGTCPTLTVNFSLTGLS